SRAPVRRPLHVRARAWYSAGEVPGLERRRGPLDQRRPGPGRVQDAVRRAARDDRRARLPDRPALLRRAGQDGPEEEAAGRPERPGAGSGTTWAGQPLTWIRRGRQERPLRRLRLRLRW